MCGVQLKDRKRSMVRAMCRVQLIDRKRSIVRAMCGVQLTDRKKIHGENNVWSTAQR